MTHIASLERCCFKVGIPFCIEANSIGQRSLNVRLSYLNVCGQNDSQTFTLLVHNGRFQYRVCVIEDLNWGMGNNLSCGNRSVLDKKLIAAFPEGLLRKSSAFIQPDCVSFRFLAVTNLSWRF